MLFFWYIILLPYYSLYIEKSYTSIQQITITLIHLQNLYVNVIIWINLIYWKNLYIRTHTHVHDIYNTRTRTYVRTRAYTYIY